VIAAFRPERAMEISRWCNHRVRGGQFLRAPAGARDVIDGGGNLREVTLILRPCWGAKAMTTGCPVVAPPANFRRASGASHDITS